MDVIVEEDLDKNKTYNKKEKRRRRVSSFFYYLLGGPRHLIYRNRRCTYEIVKDLVTKVSSKHGTFLLATSEEFLESLEYLPKIHRAKHNTAQITNIKYTPNK